MLSIFIKFSRGFWFIKSRTCFKSTCAQLFVQGKNCTINWSVKVHTTCSLTKKRKFLLMHYLLCRQDARMKKKDFSKSGSSWSIRRTSWCGGKRSWACCEYPCTDVGFCWTVVGWVLPNTRSIYIGGMYVRGACCESPCTMWLLGWGRGVPLWVCAATESAEHAVSVIVGILEMRLCWPFTLLAIPVGEVLGILYSIWC